MPSIQKASRIRGNKMILRNADVSDSGFIVSLRTDPRKNKFISPTSAELEAQIEWMRRYEIATDQAYFIIEDAVGRKIGTIRIYDPIGDSFCWGSWIIKNGVPFSCGVESLLILYNYALDNLGFAEARYTVRKANRSIWQFMERFGGERTGETEIDYHYGSGKDRMLEALERYSRFLPRPITVIM